MATCATPILNATRAGEHTDFPQKNAAATIYFSANAIWGLFKATIRSAAFIQGNAVSVVEPSKARAIVYGSSNTVQPNAGH